MIDWNAKELDGKNFFEEIKTNGYPVFVDFWASWCPPCRMMDPLIDEMAERFEGKVIVRKLNTDFYPAISGKINISGVPTYIIFKEGKEVWRNVGAIGKKKLRETFESFVR